MSDDQLISGEAHHAKRQVSSGRSKQFTVSSHTVGIVAAAVVLCALSFLGGIAYQKHHTPTNASAASGRTGGGFGGPGGFARRGGGLGQVTAISSTSITITNQRTNSSQSFTINSSTTISDNSQTVPYSNIQNGDTVLIMTSGSGSMVATRILVNPSFGGTSAPGVTSGVSPSQTN